MLAALHFIKEQRTHMSPDLVCGASAQNQAAKLFWFFREDDGYNETFSAAKCFIIVLKVSFMWKYANDSIKEMKWWIITILFYFTFPFIKYKHCNIVTISSVRGRLILSTCTAHTAGRHVNLILKYLNVKDLPMIPPHTSRPALSAVQVLKIRRPRTDKIVTILQCLYLINGKVK